MPYIKHENGFDAAHVDHRGGTLGGFDQLIRCRGHYPDPTPCDDVIFAWVPDEDVCPNCTVVTEDEYDDFHSARTVHIYEHHFIPAIEDRLTAVDREHTDAGENIVNLEKEKGRANAKAADILDASERIADLHRRRHDLGNRRGEIERVLNEHREELEQAKRDVLAKGDSVRKRRLRQEDTSNGKDGR